MPNTFTKIASNTVSTAVSSVTFSSIPATFTDLVLKMSTRSTGNDGNPWTGTNLTLNGNAITVKRLYGTGSGSGSSDSSTPGIIMTGNTATANTFSNSEVYIPNYTSANFKSLNMDSVTETNAATTIAMMSAGLCSFTAAVTSLVLTPGAGNFDQYSTFTLYGIKNS